MGQDKSDVLVRDQTMLEMVGAAIRRTADQVVLLGPEREGWESWPDIISAHGPLAGITTALGTTSHDMVVVVAVDHPFVRPQTLTALVERCAELPVVPVDDHGTRQVTCAAYPTMIADVAREEAESGGSIQSLLDRVAFDPVTPKEWESWGEDGRSWFSIDSPGALEEALTRFT
jgi:molybdopterin-guanine dinucleotide biosynthesis protein A